MPDDERCPLNPSLRKIECSHCQGPPRGTHDNPVFSLEEGFFNGFPVVEVLKNAGPVHAWDKHWCFRTPKAEIMVACIPVLREFWQATDQERLSFADRRVEDDGGRVRIQICVKMHPDFEHSTGKTIYCPWLHLIGLQPVSVDIGLGAIKCRAICEVEQDLRRWLQRHKAFV